MEELNQNEDINQTQEPAAPETAEVIGVKFKASGKTYYFDPENECMVYGLTTVGGATYYFGEDGAAVTGEVEINGTVYIFGDDGKRIG